VPIEAKDVIYAGGLVVTLGLGAWNFANARRAARRASFINTVTGQRVLWIERLRQDVSRFVGFTHSWTRASENDVAHQQELLKEIDTLRYVIRLRLNPDDTIDRKIAALVKKIPDLTDISHRSELDAALDDLVNQTQLLLKVEWEKVKAESKDGDLKES
jgi:hypothetical protein